MYRLAKEVPEAAVHFQGEIFASNVFACAKSDLGRSDTVLYKREKDSRPSGAVGEWMRYLVENDPWYKDVVPDVSPLPRITT